MQRRSIVVDGIVQGVGFRPFVHRLASECRLAGFVRNHAGSVRIEVEGDPADVERFASLLAEHHRAGADRIESARQVARANRRPGFAILPSDAKPVVDPRQTFIAADVATCEACLAELFDPANRRFVIRSSIARIAGRG